MMSPRTTRPSSTLCPKDWLRLLDLGCGPGRDLLHFRKLGHEPTGLDGSPAFCEMARKHAGCPVWHQNFLQLALPSASFDGVFANASLFHVPQQELPRVLAELRDALVPEGVLFSSNPRGGVEGWSGERYGAYLDWDTYRKYLEGSGFEPVHHYYRPRGFTRRSAAVVGGGEQEPEVGVASGWRTRRPMASRCGSCRRPSPG
jgi:SAM-dependent methyltransferase